MKLIVQPDDGVAPLLAAIRHARKSVDIMVFRFDRSDLRRRSRTRSARGVAVRTLIAHTNSEGPRSLRKLELDLLAAGITVARTADDLVRYHAKFFIIDCRPGFHPRVQLHRARHQQEPELRRGGAHAANVQELLTLFEADAGRQPYKPGVADLLVSPLNARDRLAAFIRAARRQLFIYDLKLSDPQDARRSSGSACGRAWTCGSSAMSLRPAPRSRGPRWTAGAFTCAPWWRTAGGRSSAARASRASNSTSVARWGSIIRDRAIVRQMEFVFAEDWAKSCKAGELQAGEGEKPAIVREVRELQWT